ncbi:MAG: TonB-dependent receptor [Saprospiraceae bacterium]|nr:TonB-dependent receptor [Saprospiraceae bacterium]MBK8669959.1 TonB-dependent receptor [Saprospiraceae bacterium]
MLVVFLLWTLTATTQNKHTLSGYIKDKTTGETLIGANVYNKANPVQGGTSNAYGFYSMTLDEGIYQMVFSYLGYQDQAFEVDLSKNTVLNVTLSEGVVIDEVVISAEKDDRRRNVEGTQMGTVELPVENIKKLPAIFGEVDILKAIQLLPGVLSSGEGNAGFYVRGGGPDQNLVLLDEAVVYNSGHMLGFFSVFNADAIKNTTLIKGSMPANFGGRLSSVLDIQMKEGNDKNYAVEGGVGLISSRLTIQGPVVKNKSSFIVSGRRTYILDLVQPALKGTNFEGTNYYFYDLNTKWNYTFSNKNRLFFSGYFGNDVLKFRQPNRDFAFDLPYGNKTATLRWNHLFSEKMFMNVSAVYNDYKFQFNGGQDDFVFKLYSGVKDWNFKIDFENYPNTKNTIRYGINYTYHTLTPNTASASNGEVDFNTSFKPKYANEGAIYLMDDLKWGSKWAINVGLRASLFQQVGPYTSKLTGQEFGRFEAAKTYGGLEPRFSLNYKANDNISIKTGIAVTNQYLHLVSNSSSTLPADVWVPSTEIVKPQRGIQYALGFFKNFDRDVYETSFEVYYKDMKNQIDYADNYVNDISKEVEDAFVFGKGRAYGAEFFIKKSKGKLNGWIGYTLSRSEKSFKDIEGGRWYPSVYDKPHNLSVVVNYKPRRKWDFGAVFVYGTGKLFTPVRGFFFVEQTVNLFYGPRNSARLDDYHRLDLSATYTPKPDSKRNFKGSWTFSVYNSYNRKNPFFVNFDTTTDFQTGTNTITGTKITIFPLIPSITYNFKWNQK